MNEESITVYLKFIGEADPVDLVIPTNLEIEGLITLATDYTDIPNEKIRLLYNGHALNRSGTIRSCNINDGDTINVVQTRVRRIIQNPPQTGIRSEQYRRLLHAIGESQRNISDLSLGLASLQINISGNNALSANRSLVNYLNRFDNLYPDILNLRSEINSYQANQNGEEVEIVQTAPPEIIDPETTRLIAQSAFHTMNAFDNVLNNNGNEQEQQQESVESQGQVNPEQSEPINAQSPTPEPTQNNESEPISPTPEASQEATPAYPPISRPTNTILSEEEINLVMNDAMLLREHIPEPHFFEEYGYGRTEEQYSPF